jgi:hypothetical protein
MDAQNVLTRCRDVSCHLTSLVGIITATGVEAAMCEAATLHIMWCASKLQAHIQRRCSCLWSPRGIWRPSGSRECCKSTWMRCLKLGGAGMQVLAAAEQDTEVPIPGGSDGCTRTEHYFRSAAQPRAAFFAQQADVSINPMLAWNMAAQARSPICHATCTPQRCRPLTLQAHAHAQLREQWRRTVTVPLIIGCMHRAAWPYMHAAPCGAAVHACGDRAAAPQCRWRGCRCTGR